MAGIYSIGGSAGHRYAGWLEQVEAKNFQFGGKVFNGSPSAIYVGSNLVWAGRWLTVAAAQTILGAFGQRDGMAVINATNAYLNGIAASDMAKAQALAGFINEDPMMVCSLGLEVEGVTMPWRYIKTDGNAYIDTGWTATGGMHAYIGFTLQSGNKLYFGSHNTSAQGSTNNYNRNQFAIEGSNNTIFNVLNMGSGNQIANKLNMGGDNQSEVSSITGGQQPFFVVNGTRSNITGISGTLAPYTTVRLFYYYWDGRVSSSSGTGFSYCKIFDKDGVAVREMYPFKRKINDVVVNGMIDVLSGTFYVNAGTGSFTIPDISYTPSTP